MSSVRSIIALFVLVFAQANACAESDCAASFLRELTATLKQPLATSSDRAQIARWFDDSTLTRNEASQKTFDLVMKRRLDIFPKDLRDRLYPEVKRLISEKEYITSKSVDGYFSSNKKIGFKAPKNMFGSVFDHETSFHEIEHGIHHELLPLDRRREIFQLGEIRFESEQAAMLAQWQILNAIPKSVRDEIVTELRNSSLSRADQKKIIGLLNTADGTGDQFLAEQWKNHNYSAENFAEGKYVEFSEIIGKKTYRALQVGLALTVYYVTCSRMKNSQSTYYRKICEPLFGFPLQRTKP